MLKVNRDFIIRELVWVTTYDENYEPIKKHIEAMSEEEFEQKAMEYKELYIKAYVTINEDNEVIEGHRQVLNEYGWNWLSGIKHIIE